MNTKQITIKILRITDILVGESIKGKGLEIFSNEKTVFYKYLGTCSNEEIEDKISKNTRRKLFIESYRISSITSWVCKSKNTS